MGIEAFGLRPSHPLCYAMLCYADYKQIPINSNTTKSINITHLGLLMNCSHIFTSCIIDQIYTPQRQVAQLTSHHAWYLIIGYKLTSASFSRASVYTITIELSCTASEQRYRVHTDDVIQWSRRWNLQPANRRVFQYFQPTSIQLLVQCMRTIYRCVRVSISAAAAWSSSSYRSMLSRHTAINTFQPVCCQSVCQRVRLPLLAAAAVVCPA